MPGYTPYSMLSQLVLLSICWPITICSARDSERFAFNIQHTDISPLGSGGHWQELHFQSTKEANFGFNGVSHPYTNSLDAVSDRDFILEFLSNASILMMHMSRLCEEIINWCSHEYKFVTLSDTFSTGSSIIPQKKKSRYG